MTYEQAIDKAVDDYIAMTKDAATTRLLRTGKLTQISNKGGYWRADGRTTFAIGDTLEEAVKELLKKEMQ